MGSDKASIPVEGVPLLERVLRSARDVAERMIVVGGPARTLDAGIVHLPDRYPAANSMGGIATALWHARNGPYVAEWVLCLACDMPFLVPEVLAHLWSVRRGADIVVPRLAAGYEPLCALYRNCCLLEFEEEIRRGRLGIRHVFPRVRTREVPEAELRRLDPQLRCFVNVNRPADLEVLQRTAPRTAGG
jgi:molybdopterin-guanine dinucleotide biosynthesis protein A